MQISKASEFQKVTVRIEDQTFPAMTLGSPSNGYLIIGIFDKGTITARIDGFYPSINHEDPDNFRIGDVVKFKAVHENKTGVIIDLDPDYPRIPYLVQDLNSIDTFWIAGPEHPGDYFKILKKLTAIVDF